MSRQPAPKRTRWAMDNDSQGGLDQPSGSGNSDRNRGGVQIGRVQKETPWLANGRFFCPVALCHRSNTTVDNGWKSLDSMKNHLKDHLAGRAVGALPTKFLDHHKLGSCNICGKLICVRSKIVCPSCAPAQRAATSSSHSDEPTTDGLPSMHEILTTGARLFKHIPKRARPRWGEVLAKTIANVVHHNTPKAWKEFLMLSKTVLFAPPRRGKSNKHDSVAFLKLRCDLSW